MAAQAGSDSIGNASQVSLYGSESPEVAPSDSASEVGRVPTPHLNGIVPPGGLARHHLDRTTPAVGGAILVSPSKDSAPRRGTCIISFVIKFSLK